MSERNTEDEYFARIDAEKKAKIKAEIDAESHAKLLAERKALHWHRCGKCGANMTTHEFRGLDIEECPECGAVLLDKDELEKLAGHDQTGIIRSLSELFGSKK